MTMAPEEKKNIITVMDYILSEIDKYKKEPAKSARYSFLHGVRPSGLFSSELTISMTVDTLNWKTKLNKVELQKAFEYLHNQEVIGAMEIRDLKSVHGLGQVQVETNEERIRAHKNKLLQEEPPKTATPPSAENTAGAVSPRLVTRDNRSSYFYDGKPIEMNKEAIYYKIFNALSLKSDQDGFLSYADIEVELVKQGLPGVEDDDIRNKRINNAILNKQQGLFRFAKVNGKTLKNKLPDGQRLIELIRGKGLKLNNPII